MNLPESTILLDDGLEVPLTEQLAQEVAHSFQDQPTDFDRGRLSFDAVDVELMRRFMNLTKFERFLALDSVRK
jgi:hypothetical protein